ncbi:MULTISPECIES: IclR family transcriptional regulator C-terminal domain-containing protein [Streptomyces]|uniref:IclR family transcriptional regulator n=1 Tax=Streptomyces TaxID=1883 RepID=UPI000B0E5E31|nr:MULTISPECIES: IclR family transcriptional regulator C-terminal domain-containing protein [Streptomyces]MDH6226854.1 DNA-binding IclR family transcriptional regulator [Streptomyces sp. MJP52]
MALNEPGESHHSVQEALRVLDTVARHPAGITDAELGRHLGLGPQRLTTLLRMLRREGYVLRLPDGAYAVGAAFTHLTSTDGHEEALRRKLQRTLDRLRDDVGAAIYLSRYDDGEVRVTQCAAGPGAPAVNEWVDFRWAAHASAVGKSLLGQLDRDGRRDHLARHRMARLTSRTITSERLLLSHLDAQPPSTPVLDLQEYAVGTVCAAVAFSAGERVGSLALSMPVSQAHRLRRAADRLHQEAAPVLLSLSIRP